MQSSCSEIEITEEKENYKIDALLREEENTAKTKASETRHFVYNDNKLFFHRNNR